MNSQSQFMNACLRLCGSVAIVSITCLSFSSLLAQTASTHELATSEAQELKFVVVVSRHGVRSPTGKVEQLNRYSAQPWPAWPVPPGYLTEHGATLMTLFGAYDRAVWTSQGLLTSKDCKDADQVAILADSDQRTRETGKALAAGLMPGCAIEVKALPEGSADPLFHPLEAGIVHADKQLATAALAGRIANNPGALKEAYRLQLQSLEDLLATTRPGDPANPQRKSIFDVPSSLAPGKADHLVDLRGPLATAATMTENLLLEYTEGMSSVGWGQVDAQKLRDLLQLHTASSDLERRTPYLARIQASNLLAHILDSMQQAVTHQPVPGALNKPSAQVLVLVGHDTNLANIGGTLNLSWLTDGRRDDTPPGGAIIFELWQRRDQGAYSVRTYYTAQTLDQMRNSTSLTLANPPERATVFLPGCSGVDASCTWSSFQSTVLSSIDPHLVQ